MKISNTTTARHRQSQGSTQEDPRGKNRKKDTPQNPRVLRSANHRGKTEKREQEKREKSQHMSEGGGNQTSQGRQTPYIALPERVTDGTAIRIARAGEERTGRRKYDPSDRGGDNGDNSSATRVGRRRSPPFLLSEEGK